MSYQVLGTTSYGFFLWPCPPRCPVATGLTNARYPLLTQSSACWVPGAPGALCLPKGLGGNKQI